MKENFAGASLPGFVTSPANSYREDLGNGAHSFPSISGTRTSNHLQMSQLRRQHIVLRYFKTQGDGPVKGLNPRPPALYNVNYTGGGI